MCMVITKNTQNIAHKLTCINMQSFACIHGSLAWVLCPSEIAWFSEQVRNKIKKPLPCQQRKSKDWVCQQKAWSDPFTAHGLERISAHVFSNAWKMPIFLSWGLKNPLEIPLEHDPVISCQPAESGVTNHSDNLRIQSKHKTNTSVACPIVCLWVQCPVQSGSGSPAAITLYWCTNSVPNSPTSYNLKPRSSTSSIFLRSSSLAVPSTKPGSKPRPKPWATCAKCASLSRQQNVHWRHTTSCNLRT